MAVNLDIGVTFIVDGEIFIVNVDEVVTATLGGDNFLFDAALFGDVVDDTTDAVEGEGGERRPDEEANPEFGLFEPAAAEEEG